MYLFKVPPIDVGMYRAMLRSIQRNERTLGALSSYAFIVQEEDIREIIETIWHGHSILSQYNIRTDLKYFNYIFFNIFFLKCIVIRLPRWKKDIDWSPWNCVCLTDQETRAHLNLKNLNDLYDEFILKDIEKKQQLAKLAFQKLENASMDYVQSGEWWQVGLNGKKRK